MHVGFITPEYPHPKVNGTGGLGTSIKNLLRELVNKNVKVSLFIYGQKEDIFFMEYGINYYFIKQIKYKVMGWYLYRKHIQNYINKVIVNEKINIIEAPDWTGITAFMRLKAPLIIRFHGSDAYFCMLDKRKQKFKNFLFEKLALRRATAFIAPTSYAGKETQIIFGLDPDKIKTIHYGLQLKDFVNRSPEQFNRNTILYIGTIIRKKGVFELAEIFNRVVESIPDARLVLIGNDSQDIKTGSTSTFSLVNELFSSNAKKKVKYLGKIPYSEVQEQIRNAHVCVFPSFAETLGMVTIESMAMQKPVVNTNIGWAKEIIDDGVNGFLVHPSNIKLYSNRILELLNDQKLCTKIGVSARLKIESTFNITINVEQNISYYNSIINSYF